MNPLESVTMDVKLVKPKNIRVKVTAHNEKTRGDAFGLPANT
jgi:hypothetical protein